MRRYICCLILVIEVLLFKEVLSAPTSNTASLDASTTKLKSADSGSSKGDSASVSSSLRIKLDSSSTNSFQTIDTGAAEVIVASENPTTTQDSVLAVGSSVKLEATADDNAAKGFSNSISLTGDALSGGGTGQSVSVGSDPLVKKHDSFDTKGDIFNAETLKTVETSGGSSEKTEKAPDTSGTETLKLADTSNIGENATVELQVVEVLKTVEEKAIEKKLSDLGVSDQTIELSSVSNKGFIPDGVKNSISPAFLDVSVPLELPKPIAVKPVISAKIAAPKPFLDTSIYASKRLEPVLPPKLIPIEPDITTSPPDDANVEGTTAHPLEGKITLDFKATEPPLIEPIDAEKQISNLDISDKNIFIDVQPDPSQNGLTDSATGTEPILLNGKSVVPNDTIVNDNKINPLIETNIDNPEMDTIIYHDASPIGSINNPSNTNIEFKSDVNVFPSEITGTSKSDTGVDPKTEIAFPSVETNMTSKNPDTSTGPKTDNIVFPSADLITGITTPNIGADLKADIDVFPGGDQITDSTTSNTEVDPKTDINVFPSGDQITGTTTPSTVVDPKADVNFFPSGDVITGTDTIKDKNVLPSKDPTLRTIDPSDISADSKIDVSGFPTTGINTGNTKTNIVPSLISDVSFLDLNTGTNNPSDTSTDPKSDINIFLSSDQITGTDNPSYIGIDPKMEISVVPSAVPLAGDNNPSHTNINLIPETNVFPNADLIQSTTIPSIENTFLKPGASTGQSDKNINALPLSNQLNKIFPSDTLVGETISSKNNLMDTNRVTTHQEGLKSKTLSEDIKFPHGTFTVSTGFTESPITSTTIAHTSFPLNQFHSDQISNGFLTEKSKTRGNRFLTGQSNGDLLDTARSALDWNSFLNLAPPPSTNSNVRQSSEFTRTTVTDHDPNFGTSFRNNFFDSQTTTVEPEFLGKAAPCLMKKHSDPSKFYSSGIEMSCPPLLVWKQNKCYCDYPGPGDQIVTIPSSTNGGSCDFLLKLGMENTYENKFPQFKVDTRSRRRRITFENVKGGNGLSAHIIRSPLLVNAFQGNDLTSTMHIKFRFRIANRRLNSRRLMILVSNGCGSSWSGPQPPSIALKFIPRNTTFKLIFRTDGKSVVEFLQPQVRPHHGWYDVALYLQDQWLNLEVNQERLYSSNGMKGSVIITPCPLKITGRTFEGYIDEFEVAKKCRYKPS